MAAENARLLAELERYKRGQMAPRAPAWPAPLPRGVPAPTTAFPAQASLATQGTPASQGDAKVGDHSPAAQQWLHTTELQLARDRKSNAERTRDAAMALTGVPSPSLDGVVAEATAKVDALLAAREAAKSPDLLLRDAQRDLARAERQVADRRAALERAEAGVRAAQAAADEERAWVAKREQEAANARLRLQAASSKLEHGGASADSAAATSSFLQQLRALLASSAGADGVPQVAAEAVDAIQRALERPALAPAAPATPLGPASSGSQDSQRDGEVLSTPGPPIAQPTLMEAKAELYVLSDEEMPEHDEPEATEEALQELLQAHREGTATEQEAILAIRASYAQRSRSTPRGARDAKRGLGGPPQGKAAGVLKSGAKPQGDR